MRLIDADDYCKKCGCKPPFGNDGGCGICVICDCPTIEAEPVRHGRWIECDYKCMEHGFIETYANGGLCCSECKTGFKKSELRIKSYCPNCWAKMDLKLPEETEKGESPC